MKMSDIRTGLIDSCIENPLFAHSAMFCLYQFIDLYGTLSAKIFPDGNMFHNSEIILRSDFLTVLCPFPI